MEMQKNDYRKYYEDVRKDFEELKAEYPYSTMYMAPTVEPKQIRLRVLLTVGFVRNQSEIFVR